MRLSMDKNDSGYVEWCKLNGDGKHVRVLLDGEEQHRCVMADEETGDVKRYVVTDAGNIALDFKNGEFLHETVNGKVQIVIEDRA